MLRPSKIRYGLSVAVIGVAIALLATNMIGLAMGERVFSGIPSSAASLKMFGRHLKIEDDRQLDRRRSETSEEYIRRLNEQINGHMVHIWPTNDKIKYSARVPFFENYILFALSKILPSRYGAYEFYDVDRALKRGVGLCSQLALITSNVLERNGIENKIIGLAGHVVASAKTDAGNWFILDSDYGVVVPHAISQIEEAPGIIKPYYAKSHSVSAVSNLIRIYGPEGNRVFDDGARGYKGRTADIERWAYVLKWVTPAVLALVAVLLHHKNTVRRKRVGYHSGSV